MYEILTQIHSFLRWAVLILLLAAIIKSLNGLLTKRAFSGSDNKISLFLMNAAHLQLVVGIWLYFKSPFVQFINPKMMDPQSRYFTMEHSVMMIIAIIFITIARMASKRAPADDKKFRRLFIYCIIALIIILIAIPWPFSHVARPWF